MSLASGLSLLRSGCAAFVIAALLALPVAAQAPAAPAPNPQLAAAQSSFEALPEAERKAIQTDLIWTGHLNSAASGGYGPLTFRAINAFKAGQGVADGLLTPAERRVLAQQAQAARDAAGFRIVSDERTGIRLGVPQTVLPKREALPTGGSRWQSADGKVTLDVTTTPASEPLEAIFERATLADPNNPGRKITYKLLRPDFFVITEETPTGKSYRRLTAGPQGLRGFSISYDKALGPGLDKLVIAINSSFEPFPTSPVSSSPAAMSAGAVQTGAPLPPARPTSSSAPSISNNSQSSSPSLLEKAGSFQPYILPTIAKEKTKTNDGRIVEFLFATNRSRNDTNRPTEFSFGRMPSLTLGAVRVRVPEDHKIGRIELPENHKFFGFTIWKDEFQKEKHFKIDRIVTTNKDSWLAMINANKDKEVLIFVHGFNTTFEDSIFRAAQISWDLQYPGTMILFSWPSKGGSLTHYDYDQNSALNARDRFIDLVNLVQTQTNASRIHVIAHSMGNRVVVDALANYAKTSNPKRINELIMASPDIDQDLFLGQVSDLEKVTSGMTLYASSNDKAMVAARSISRAPKAGDFDERNIMQLNTVDLIDTSAIGDELFGLNHTSFAERRSLINDIKLIIRRGLRPPNERLTEIHRMPPGGTGRPSFWRFVN